jgi:DcuC family C4-dicarboxylate transporter
MKSTPPNRNLLAWRIAAILSIALMTLVGMQLQPTPQIALALVLGAGAFFLIKRKIFDARVVFALCGVGLGLVFGTLRTTLGEMKKWQPSNITIMAAYGFAALIAFGGFVKELASIAADFRFSNRSSVLFLTTSCITFVINAVILSAGASCAVVAPIFVPLLIRLRFPAPVAAATVVIGAWGGFLNPADTGGKAISDAFPANDMYSIPAMHIGPAILALVAANITFALMNRKENTHGQRAQSVVDFKEVLHQGTARLRVIVPILPFLLLIPVEFVTWFLGWRDKLKVDYRLLICLVVATIVASVVVVRDSGQGGKKVLPITKLFFGGMWKGFAEVIVLIVAAKLFISPFVDMIKDAAPVAAKLAFVSVPTAFLASAMTGSGDAIASAVIPLVVPLIQQSTVHPGAVASMLWLATEMGRSVSPISAATLTCARAVAPKEIDNTTVARHALRPLLVGFVVGCLALYVVFKVFK